MSRVGLKVEEKVSFNDRLYTKDAVIKQLGLIELHCKDGSAIEAGCQCIDTKHLYLIEGLTEEGMGFALSAKEREFFEQLGDFVRLARKRMDVEDWNLHGVMREVMKKKHPTPLYGNPVSLTACETAHPEVRKKLRRCIKKLEPKERAGEIESAVAVCRSSIPCP